MSDLKDDFELEDSALYANFDAFKTLVDAGLSRAEALERVGLTAAELKELEDEEASLEFQDEFKDEVWEDGDDLDDEWGSSESENEFGEEDEFGGSGGGYNDFD